MTVKQVYINNKVYNEKGMNIQDTGESLILKESILCNNDATSEIEILQKLL